MIQIGQRILGSMIENLQKIVSLDFYFKTIKFNNKKKLWFKKDAS